MASKRGFKGKGIFAAFTLMIAAFWAGALLPGCSSVESVAQKDAVAYIGAVEKRDFDAVFNYNATAQKRKAIIARGSADKEQGLKELYQEFKASFDAAEPAGDLRAQWAEKWLFVPGMSYRIIKVEKVIDTENPSQPANERTNASVIIEAEYKDRDSAPDLSGKVKGAEYSITMVQGKNVSRILRDEIKDNRWLFHSVAVNRDKIAYWP